ncbi:MAG: hypothetical protein ACI4M9_07430 [Succinivibrio sp.]
MSQDLLYSVIQRPPLGAENLVYRRRVGSASGKSESKKTASKEHRYSSENKQNIDADSATYDRDKSEKRGFNIDDTV